LQPHNVSITTLTQGLALQAARWLRHCFMGQFPAPNPVEHPKEQSKIATHNANANFTLFFAMQHLYTQKMCVR